MSDPLGAMCDLLAWGVDLKRDLVCTFRHSAKWKFLSWEEDGRYKVAYFCRRCNRYR